MWHNPALHIHGSWAYLLSMSDAQATRAKSSLNGANF